MEVIQSVCRLVSIASLIIVFVSLALGITLVNKKNCSKLLDVLSSLLWFGLFSFAFFGCLFLFLESRDAIFRPLLNYFAQK